MTSEDRDEQDPRQSLIAEILAAEDRGEMIDRQSLLARHPEHAEFLCDFFADHDRMKSAEAGLPTLPLPSSKPANREPTMAPAPVEDPAHPPGAPSEDDSTLPLTASMSKRTGPTVGDQIRYFGDYELLEEIARGGMGVVFKARQVKLNRIVAIKMILSGNFAGAEEIHRFYTEAEAAANLDHPGIVPIYEIGAHAGQHYFSMGLIDGESLQDKLRAGPLSSREAAEITRKVAQAVGFANERGVIHRDLKPANILINSAGEPVVTDFGLAKKVKAENGITRTGVVMGTPSFMPPEQAAGKSEIGPAADVYSLGAVLYDILTGRPPFQSANVLDTIMQVLEREPVAPRQLDPEIERDLETICLKCLSKDPHRRYASAQELADDLGRFLNDQPILARPPNVWERVSRWARQHVVTVTTIMLLLASSTVMIPFVQLDQLFREAQKQQQTEADGSANFSFPPSSSLEIVPARSTEIIREMTRLLQEQPENAAALLSRAQAYFAEGEDEQVIRDLSAAIERDDQSADCYLLRGLAQLRQERFDSAIKDFTRAIDLRPDWSDAHFRRAQAWLGAEDLQESLQDVGRSIDLRPGFAEGYLLRGRIFQRQGKTEQATEDFQSAKRLGLQPPELGQR